MLESCVRLFLLAEWEKEAMTWRQALLARTGAHPLAACAGYMQLQPAVFPYEGKWLRFFVV
jgi:hypothetical protein